MIGLNGGLIGDGRSPRRGVAKGLWTPNEQVIYRRQSLWTGDADFDSVSLLLHMDGSNASTTFTDSSLKGQTVTANGNAQISTSQSKFGGSSAAFDGNSDWLAVTSDSALALDSGDFTIEMFVYFNAVSANQGLYDTIAVGGSGTRSTGLVWYLTSANKLSVFSGGSDRGPTAATLSSATWYHIALVRASGTFSYFINGTKDATTFTLTTNFTDTNALLGRIGDGTYWLNGYIDELRVTKGVARYSANFTAPTAAFANA